MEPAAVDGESIIRRLKGLELREDVDDGVGVRELVRVRDDEELGDRVSVCDGVVVDDAVRGCDTVEVCVKVRDELADELAVDDGLVERP